MKKTVRSFGEAKLSGAKLAVLTAYDYSVARLADASGVDAILVGDSLANVVMGMPDTLSVTMDMMIHHTRAVSAGVENALLVGDMPFMSYQATVSGAVENAGRFLKEGRAQAVKLEGGEAVAPQIRAIVEAGIPVMGHVGLTPQSVNVLGGFKVQGKSGESKRKLAGDAKAVEEAGAFAVVVECVPDDLAAELTGLLSVPTIGIGAGPACDGQVLVYHDLIGLFPDYAPRFAKRYLNAGELIGKAFSDFAREVREGKFPGPEHSFHSPEKPKG
ncbi:MAG: 3-methyl-2-oxobutanoate hydroxymethyltransferase [Deltaproteobacteria bacterium]|jgi:3-methyl-2-oxobutanoate hydroxymethyltransferase|nr:3-methyl-2-oxobutanoate hydroxymethyltransferase [Deltaproteobacteria bacterium]